MRVYGLGSVAIGLLLSVLLCGACSMNRAYLQTELAGRSEIDVTYTVILYGAHYYNNIATVAILIPEGGKYTLDIYSPEYNYRTLKGESAADAVRTAEKFVGWHPDFIKSQTSKVLDGTGRVVAYEIRPLYNQVTFGMSDVMDIDYLLRDNNRVVVHIDLRDRARRIFMGDDQGKVH